MLRHAMGKDENGRAPRDLPQGRGRVFLIGRKKADGVFDPDGEVADYGFNKSPPLLAYHGLGQGALPASIL
jgi:hypothetical protein